MPLLDTGVKMLFSAIILTTIIFVYIGYHTTRTAEEKTISSDQHMINFFLVLLGALQAFG